MLLFLIVNLASMIVYIKDRVSEEVIFKTNEVSVVYGNELIFKRQKASKILADALSNSILFLVHREASHFISYTAEIDHSIVTLTKNLIAVVFDLDNAEYNKKYLEYIYICNKFINEIKNTSNSNL